MSGVQHSHLRLSGARRFTRGAARGRARSSHRLQLEALEERRLLAVDTFRAIDGALRPSEWGHSDEQLLRIAPAACSHGAPLPSKVNRPEAREFSNVLAANTGDSTFEPWGSTPGSMPAEVSGRVFTASRHGAAERPDPTSSPSDPPTTIVTPQSSDGFDIQFAFNGMTASQRAIFEQAARKWESIIVGDLPNATYNGQTVDDLLIDARASAIDGRAAFWAKPDPTGFATDRGCHITG